MKNFELKDGLIEEYFQTKRVYEHFYQNKYDGHNEHLNEQMIKGNMKILIPLMKERAELRALIKRGCPVDSTDIQRLAGLERMRDILLYPESEEQRLKFMQEHDDHLHGDTKGKVVELTAYRAVETKERSNDDDIPMSIKSRDIKALER